MKWNASVKAHYRQTRSRRDPDARRRGRRRKLTLIGLKGKLSNSIPRDHSLVIGDASPAPSREVRRRNGRKVV